MQHPKLDEPLPEKPEYENGGDEEIDYALKDLLKAAQHVDDDYHAELAANLLGAHRIEHTDE